MLLTAALTLASSVTSIRTISTPRMGSADCGLRTVPNTRAPRSASNCAISRPMPEVIPVTNVVLFFNEVCIYTYEFLVYRLWRHSGFLLIVQIQRCRFEIGKTGGPALFTESYDNGTLSGLPGRR